METIFVIDTNQYAGNFEREMATYMTGAKITSIDYKPYQQDYLKSNVQPMEGLLFKGSQKYSSPTTLIPTPGMKNNGLGFEFKEGDEDLALEKFKISIKQMAERRLMRLESQLSNPNDILTPSAHIAKEKQRLLDEIEEANELKEITFYPAFMSVGIHFSNLTEENIETLKLRAYLFAEKMPGLKVTGFRVLMGNSTLLS